MYSDTINEIISTLNYIFHRNLDPPSILYKSIDHNISYTLPIDVIVIPKIIYIFTDNIKSDNRNGAILNFYIELLKKIHNNINKNNIYYSDKNSTCRIIKDVFDKEITLIHGDWSSQNLHNIQSDNKYSIRIYSDTHLQNTEPTYYHLGNVESISDINNCIINICHSKEVDIKNKNLSVFLYI